MSEIASLRLLQRWVKTETKAEYIQKLGVVNIYLLSLWLGNHCF